MTDVEDLKSLFLKEAKQLQLITEDNPCPSGSSSLPAKILHVVFVCFTRAELDNVHLYLVWGEKNTSYTKYVHVIESWIQFYDLMPLMKRISKVSGSKTLQKSTEVFYTAT